MRFRFPNLFIFLIKFARFTLVENPAVNSPKPWMRLCLISPDALTEFTSTIFPGSVGFIIISLVVSTVCADAGGLIQCIRPSKFEPSDLIAPILSVMRIVLPPSTVLPLASPYTAQWKRLEFSSVVARTQSYSRQSTGAIGNIPIVSKFMWGLFNPHP